MIAQAATYDSRELVFRRWLKQHTGLVFKVARTFAPSHADRDDLVQEILLQLWRSLPRFEGKARESTWIYRVALNTALAWHRSENKRRAAQTPVLAIEELPERDDLDRRERKELVAKLYAAIRRLPKVDAALLMLYLDDLSYHQIADVLGLSETNVGVKLNRARKTLAELMKEVPHGR
jgi:RNA polymerase sigma-70 factor (ECF subfamily)